MEDRARKLIERGRKEAARIGDYMSSHALIPDRVMTSPSARTQETWKFAAAAFRRHRRQPSRWSGFTMRRHMTILNVVREATPATHTLLVMSVITPVSTSSQRC